MWMPAESRSCLTFARVSSDISGPKAPGRSPPRVWPGKASILWTPALSALASAFLKDTKWKVHIWTPIFQSVGDAAEVTVEASFKREAGCNKARLIKQQEEKCLMQIVFNIRLKISEFLRMVSFSSVYSLILIGESMFNMFEESH